MPVFVVSLPLVDVVAEDGGAAAELGHLPTQDHGVAVTVQEGDPIRVGRDGCRRHGGKVTRVPAPQPETPRPPLHHGWHPGPAPSSFLSCLPAPSLLLLLKRMVL